MKKTIIKAAVFLAVFLGSLLLIGRFMNQGHSNMTMDMAPATFPVVTMEKDGIPYNELHGYRDAMNVAFQRETVTELGANRDTEFTVDTYGNHILGISVELRSTDGERLIENSPVTGWEEKNQKIRGRVALKDLMDADTEYTLVFLLDTELSGTIRFYTRVIWSEKTHASEKLAFVKDFHESLYDKEEAEKLVTYLESNSSGDNTSFHKVDIHSSFQQITWGELNVKEVSAPVIQVREMASQTASFLLDYVVSTSEGKRSVYYQVEEYYRVRYTADRMYLLNYERTMTQIPDVEKMYANDKILLGIVGEDMPFVESTDGNILVFEAANRLCSYNVTTNKLAVLFCFYDKDNADVRTLYDQHSVKVLDVDEGGNVRFAVYGYMNRGRHEGEVGVQICYYDSALNTVEEAVYLPYAKTYAVLSTEMEQLLYMNREEKLYLFLENTVYGVDLQNKTYQKMVTIEQDDSMQVSENHKILVWQEGSSIYQNTRLYVSNLSLGEQNVIQAEDGDVLRPLGFMGEDIIYGVARQEDVVLDNTGRIFFPMYKVCIRDSAGNLLKEYSQSGMYITGCSVEENQITLERLSRDEAGAYRDASEEHIMNNVEQEEGKNKLVTAIIDKYEKYVQIQTRNPIDTKTVKVLTPKEVVFEGGRNLELEPMSGTPRYYVYGAHGVNGIYNLPARAVNLAYDTAGVVVDEQGNCIWMRGNRASRNQIMAIKEKSVTEEKNSLAVCLDTILELEGIVRNSDYLLNQGQNAMDILQDNLENAQVLDLTGCTLDAALYYVNQDIPVLVTLEDGEAVLVTGFNELQVVIMEPSKGTLYKKGMNDSAEWFLENGNQFITYIKNAE